MDYKGIKIEKTRRKTIAIYVEKDGVVRVRAPHFCNKTQIIEFIEAKKAWIDKQLYCIQQQLAKRRSKEFIPGEQFYYLGNPHMLKIQEGVFGIHCKEASIIMPKHYLSYAKKLLISWYREEAEKIILPRVEHYAIHLDKQWKKIALSNAEKKWGSCTSNGVLRFSWKLIMAPISIIDYVIVHELVHIDHMHHKKTFWDAVEKILPDYQDRRKWLKSNEHVFCI